MSGEEAPVLRALPEPEAGTERRLGRGKLLAQALRDTAPLLAGMTPFAVAFGALAVARGIPASAVIGMSAAVYAGLAQFTVVNLYTTGTEQLGFLLVFVALINLRFSLMGVSLLPHTREQANWVRGLLAFGLSDEPYAVVINRFTTHGYDLAYQVFVYILVYATWVIGTTFGVALAEVIDDPLAWGVDFAAVAAFVVLLLPRLRGRAAVMAAMVSGVAAILGQRTAMGEGAVLTGSLAGIAVGAGYRRWACPRGSTGARP